MRQKGLSTAQEIPPVPEPRVESREPEFPIRANHQLQRAVSRAATEPGRWADSGRQISGSATARSGGRSWFVRF